MGDSVRLDESIVDNQGGALSYFGEVSRRLNLWLTGADNAIVPTDLVPRRSRGGTIDMQAAFGAPSPPGLTTAFVRGDGTLKHIPWIACKWSRNGANSVFTSDDPDMVLEASTGAYIVSYCSTPPSGTGTFSIELRSGDVAGPAIASWNHTKTAKSTLAGFSASVAQGTLLFPAVTAVPDTPGSGLIIWAVMQPVGS